MPTNYTNEGPIGSIAFLVRPSGAQSNMATGGVTVIWGTEVFDIGSNFASNQFTAPVTGKYQLNVSLYSDHLDATADHNEVKIVTSNRTATINCDFGEMNGDPVYWSYSLSHMFDMDTSDTAYVLFNQGGGVAQADLEGTGSMFSGCLIG